MAKPRAQEISKAIYISASDCDSMIGFVVQRSERRRGKWRVYGTLDLSDCTRKIEWTFNSDTGIKKIDKAIEMLKEFREEFSQALKRRQPRKRRKVAIHA
jgi:hypothetical protein